MEETSDYMARLVVYILQAQCRISTVQVTAHKTCADLFNRSMIVEYFSNSQSVLKREIFQPHHLMEAD